MSSSPPKHSLSSPTATTNDNPVLPTPTSSTSVNLRPFNANGTANEINSSNLLQRKKELEQQIIDKQKLLEESSSGIGKNVLARQITQLQNKIEEIEDKINNGGEGTLSEPLSASSSSSSVEKLRSLERDVANYRAHPLSPGISSIRNKDKLLNQRSSPSTSTNSSGDPLPSPSASTLLPPHIAVHHHNHHHDSPSSLLPLPPPPTGSTPTKRRSKVPAADRRNTDIEFATEIGQGLLLEVRKMQALLQEKEEKLRTLENQKADLERAAEAMAKQMRQREENEEKLKEETWNLELAKQELVISVTELQSNLTKANAEQNKLAKQVNELRAEIEQLRVKEEKLTATIENMKQRHEQDMSSIRRHAAAIQREKADQTKQIETLTSELAIAKAQSRIGKHASIESDLNSRAGHSGDAIDLDQTKSTAAVKDDKSPTSSPPSSPKLSPARNAAMEVETLKTSLAHAHRMVSNLRSNLHKEKTEKFELKKLLAESQETIEQLQNDPRMWEDAGPIRNGGSSANGNGRGGEESGRRSHKASTTASSKRRAKKMSMTTATARNQRIPKDLKSNSNNISDTDSVYSYSSMSSDDSEENDYYDESDAVPDNSTNVGKSRSRSSSIASGAKKRRLHRQQQQQQHFTPLSSELSQSLSKPVVMDAEVMTDPIDFSDLASITNASSKTSLTEQQLSEQSRKPRTLEDELGMANQRAEQSPPFTPTVEKDQEASEQSGIMDTIKKAAVAGAAVVGMGSLMDELNKSDSNAAKEGVEIATQTDSQPGIEIITQTDAFEKKSDTTEIAVQTDDPVISEVSVQTDAESKPEVIDVFMQTEEEPVIVTAEVFTQTDEENKPSKIDVFMQTEAAQITEILVQTDELPEPETAEVSIQTDVEPKPDTTEVFTQTDVETMPETIEISMQTEPEWKPELVEIYTQTEPELTAETIDMTVQTDEEEKSELVDVTTQTEPDESHAQHGMAAIAAATTAATVAAIASKAASAEHVEASVQTDTESVVESTVESIEMSVQTDDEPFVESSETFVQAGKEEKEPAVNRELLDVVEVATQTETSEEELVLESIHLSSFDQTPEDSSVAAVDEETQYDLVEPKPVVVDHATQSEKILVADQEIQYEPVESTDFGVQCNTKTAVNALTQSEAIETKDSDAQCEAVKTKDAAVQYDAVDDEIQTNFDMKSALVGGLLGHTLQQQHNEQTDIKADVHEQTDIAPELDHANTRFKKEIVDNDADNKSDVFYEAEDDYGNVIVHLPADSANSSLAAYHVKNKHSPVELTDGPTIIHELPPKNIELSSRNTMLPVIVTSPTNELPDTIPVKTPHYAMNKQDSTTSSDISLSDVPPRPSNPPPAALLEKAGRLSMLSSDAHSSVTSIPPSSIPAVRGNHQPNLSNESLNQHRHQVDPTSPGTPLPQQQLHALEKRNTIGSVSSLSTDNTNEQLQSITSSNSGQNAGRIALAGNSATAIPQTLTSSTTDPRIINMITQTMIGDWLWKYTRKAMGGGMSENRHQRYFWIHPYTLTLYWSTNAPGVDVNDAKAKSALIENIKTVPDHTLTQQGLPSVSLLIQTSHRQLKITAPTMEKHELWLASISYLLDRVEQGSTAGLTLLRNANKKMDALGTVRSTTSSLTNGAGGSSSHSGSLFARPSFRRIQEIFHHPSTSTSTQSSSVAAGASASADHLGSSNNNEEEDDDEAIEDVRMCCNGKHHVSKLEKAHTHRHHHLHHNYRKRKSLRRGRGTVKTIG